MTALLASNSYGKSAVRMVKLERRGQRHDIRDLTVDIALEGEFEDAHTVGDNSMVLPTDTMKNTVYAKARERSLGEPEEFARLLGEHFLAASKSASLARVRVAEHGWRRLDIGGRPHDHSFQRGSSERRVAHVTSRRQEEPTIIAGIEELIVLKSAQSAFAGYAKDRYTTLRETADRILATSISTYWRYADGATSFGVLWESVRRTLLGTFAEHDSRSVQHTLYAMADAVLETSAEVEEISIAMPNKHHLLVDLAPFGLENPNEIFVPTDEPFGLIEATVTRDRSRQVEGERRIR